MKIAFTLIFGLVALGFYSEQSPMKLGAPTYFIAATAEYRDSHEIWVRGTSDLPAGAILVVDIQDYVGEGGHVLAERALPKVGKDGFFEATLVPSGGNQFKHNVVCLVSFGSNFPTQDAQVIQIVGRRGEHLGFPKNPQAGIMSGERVYLSSSVHVD